MLTLVQRRRWTAEFSPGGTMRLYCNLLAGLVSWHSRARQRDALSRLDDHLLADIGITREAQMVECSKPFWCP
jgi:YD repeat-containing protein